MVEDASVESLVSKLKSGLKVEECFSLLFERYYSRVYRAFPRWVDSETRRDLTQDVFTRVHRGISSCPVDAFQPWLLRIARNVFASWLESSHRLKRRGIEVGWQDAEATLSGIESEDSKCSPLDQLLTGERAAKLREAIEELSPQQRRCMLMRVNLGSTDREIAQALRLKLGTVKSHLNGARQLLRARLFSQFAEIDFEVDRGSP